MESKSFCFIPAKSQSQRLPGKNVRKLNGKELIYYPIQCARESGLFGSSDIVVSSESETIRDLAASYGANVNYHRPDRLARDPFGVKDVLIDYLTQHGEHSQFDDVCILLPTAPLMATCDITNAYKMFRTGEYKTVISVSETDHNALRSVYLENNKIRPIHPEFIACKSQELPPTYRINGAVILISVQQLLKNQSYFVEPIGGFSMPSQRSIDIDTEMDLKLAEFIVAQSTESD